MERIKEGTFHLIRFLESSEIRLQNRMCVLSSLKVPSGNEDEDDDAAWNLVLCSCLSKEFALLIPERAYAKEEH